MTPALIPFVTCIAKLKHADYVPCVSSRTHVKAQRLFAPPIPKIKSIQPNDIQSNTHMLDLHKKSQPHV